MARRVSLEIVGDSSSLERAFANAASSAKRFNQQVGRSTRQFDTAQVRAHTAAVKGNTAAEKELFRVRSRRAASLGPFRLAGVGLGAGAGLFAATQVVRDLGQRLETTGDAAFTTEGRLKNMVSALTSGNIVGAVSALGKLPQTIEQMGWTVEEVRKRQAALNQVADGTTAAFEHLTPGVRAHTAEMEKAKAVTEAAGGASQRQAEILTEGLVAFDAATTAAKALADQQERLGKYYVTRAGQVIKGTAIRDMTRVQDVASDGRSTRQSTRPVSIRPLSPSQRRELELIGQQGTARIGNLQDRLRQLRNQLGNLHGTANVREEQRLKTLTNIKNTEAEIASIYAAQAAARKAAAEAAKRDAEAAKREAEAAAEKLKSLRDAIKAAVLERLQRRQTDVLNNRALTDAREQMRIARRLGGPAGIEEARRGLQDVGFDMQRARLEAAPASLSRGGRFALGGVVININGVTDPDAVARKVVAVLQKRSRRTTTQTRPTAAGQTN